MQVVTFAIKQSSIKEQSQSSELHFYEKHLIHERSCWYAFTHTHTYTIQTHTHTYLFGRSTMGYNRGLGISGNLHATVDRVFMAEHGYFCVCVCVKLTI